MTTNSILSNFGETPGGARSIADQSFNFGVGRPGSATDSLTGAMSAARAASQESFESQLRSAMSTDDETELKDACVKLEEYMVGLLYKQMKATVQRAEVFGSDAGRETYEEWQDEQMVKEIAANGSIGFADMMFKQLSKRMKNAYELADGS